MIEPDATRRVGIKKGWAIIWNQKDKSISMANGEDSFIY